MWKRWLHTHTHSYKKDTQWQLLSLSHTSTMRTHSTETHTHTAGVSQLTLEALHAWPSQGQRWFLWKLHPVWLRVCLYQRCWWFDLPQVCVSGILTPGQGSWMLLELTTRHVNSVHVSLMLFIFLLCICHSSQVLVHIHTCSLVCLVQTKGEKNKINCCL